MRITSKRLLLPLVLGIAFCQSLAFAQSQSAPPGPPPCEVLQVDKLIGGVSLSLGIDRAVIPAMSCFLKLWREDQGGGTKSVLSNAFLAVMEQNPQRFFSTMVNEPRISGEWLAQERLQGRSFSWPFPPPCELEVKRKLLISALEHTAISGDEELAIKRKVIATLSAIRCSQLN